MEKKLNQPTNPTNKQATEKATQQTAVFFGLFVKGQRHPFYQSAASVKSASYAYDPVHLLFLLSQSYHTYMYEMSV